MSERINQLSAVEPPDGTARGRGTGMSGRSGVAS